MVAERWLRRVALPCLLLATACASRATLPVVDPELHAAAQQGDALAISDALEVLIESGAATPPIASSPTKP